MGAETAAHEPAIPVVDLSKNGDEAVADLKTACEKYGFFYLEGHGLVEETRESVYDQARKFFALPYDEKAKVHAAKNPHNRGWNPMGEETLDVKKQTEGDTKEGYYIGREIGPEHKLSGVPLHGPNVWPDDEKLPGWKGTMEAYFEHMEALGHRLLKLIAKSLELETNYFDDKFNEPLILLRLLHYSATKSCVNAEGKGVYACGAHTDYGMLTLLSTDSVPGLQIQTKSGEWIDVPPRKDALIVNLGDMLERWTNGRYRSTLHRVLNLTGQERYSIPFFFEPNFHTVVECFPSCCSESNPAKYPPKKYGQHILDKYAETHAEFKHDAQQEGRPKSPQKTADRA